MNNDERLRKMIDSKAIDLHVHVGDQLHLDGSQLKRMWTVDELSALGMITVAKAHFMDYVPESRNVHGSVTLNDGDPIERIQRASELMTKPWVVWGPTLYARAHHEVVKDDPLWRNLFGNISLDAIVNVLDEKGEISAKWKEIIKEISASKAIFATGRLSQSEVSLVVPYAIQAGVKTIILTHVSSRHNRVSLEEQQRLIQLGQQAGCMVYAEHCAITFIDGKEGAYEVQRDFAHPIRSIEPSHLLVTSDTGRFVDKQKNPHTPISPQECLFVFCQALMDAGVSLAMIEQLMVENPRKILGSST